MIPVAWVAADVTLEQRRAAGEGVWVSFSFPESERFSSVIWRAVGNMVLLRSSYPKDAAESSRKSPGFPAVDVDSVGVFFHRHFSLQCCFLSWYDPVLPCPPFPILLMFGFN